MMTLMAGTVISQAIPILISPVLTRLYTPEDFGILAVFLSIFSMISVFTTAKTDAVLIIPKNDEDSMNLFSLGMIITLIVSFLSLIFFTFFSQPIQAAFSIHGMEGWLLLLPLSVLLQGAYVNLYYWFNRKKAFRQTSVNNVSQSVSSSGFRLLLGFFPVVSGGLILGQIAGQIVSVGHFLVHFRKWWQPLRSAVSMKSMKEQWRRFRRLLATLILSNGIQSFYIQIPTFFIARFFDLATLGFVSLSTRVVSLPITLISNALGDVFRQRATEDFHKHGNFRDIFLSTIKKTLLLSFLPFVLLYFVIPPLFTIIFGKEWLIAGEYMQILLIGEFFAFIINPIDKASLIREKKRYMLYWNTSRLAANFLIVGLAILFSMGIREYLWMLVALRTGHYLANLVFCYRFSLGK